MVTVRVRGLVSTAQYVRKRLGAGIADPEGFRQVVGQAIATVDHALARHGLSSRTLADPTRKAYDFLKGLDLDQLPPPREGSGARPVRGPRITNTARNERGLLASMTRLARGNAPEEAERARVRETAAWVARDIEQLCAERQAAPADLPAPSRRVYGLFKFLSEEANFVAHLEATRRAAVLAQEVLARRGDARGAVVEFTNGRALWRRKESRAAVALRLNEGFIRAGDEVLRALVEWALGDEEPGRTRRVRDYSRSGEFADVLLEIELETEVLVDEPRGHAHDLSQAFDSVNREYFAGALSPPRLTWSRQLSVRRVGYYEHARDRVVVSASLDGPRVPAFVVEFVAYHELLHRTHGGRWQGSRHAAHTPEFRADERRFRQYAEAKAWLAKMPGG